MISEEQITMDSVASSAFLHQFQTDVVTSSLPKCSGTLSDCSEADIWQFNEHQSVCSVTSDMMHSAIDITPSISPSKLV